MNKTGWIFIGGTVLVLVGFGLLYLWPVISDDWQIYKAGQKTRQDLKDVSQKKEMLAKLSQDNQLETLYQTALKYIPKEADSSGLVIELSAIANSLNLKIEQVSFEGTKDKIARADEDATDAKTAAATNKPASPAPASGPQEIKFSIKVLGDYPSVLAFLQNIETSSRLVSIQKLTISTDEKGLSGEIEGKAFYTPQTNLQDSLTNITVSTKTIEKFKNLKTYGVPINLPTEEGFGRTNPFDTTTQ